MRVSSAIYSTIPIGTLECYDDGVHWVGIAPVVAVASTQAYFSQPPPSRHLIRQRPALLVCMRCLLRRWVVVAHDCCLDYRLDRTDMERNWALGGVGRDGVGRGEVGRGGVGRGGVAEV